DRDVEDFPFDHPNQLRLRMAQLEVQSAQRALDRPRVVVLHEHGVDAMLAVPRRVIRLETESAAVHVHVRLDDEHAGQGRTDDPHVRIPDRGCGTGIDRMCWIPSRAPAWRGRPPRCTPYGTRSLRGRRP